MYCGQTVGRIKMKLGMQVGLDPGHIALDGTQPHKKERGTAPPQFSAQLRYGQTPLWIKMPLGVEVDLGPGDFVLDGDPAPLHQKRSTAPVFGPCLLAPQICFYDFGAM